MSTPTREDLTDILELVEEKILESTRWGYVQRDVYKREEDGTFWGVSFRVDSGDNDYRGLYDDEYDINQVYPKKKTITVYE